MVSPSPIVPEIKFLRVSSSESLKSIWDTNSQDLGVAKALLAIHGSKSYRSDLEYVR